MRDFVAEFKARLKKLEEKPNVEPKPVVKDTVPRFNLVSVFGGERRIVGFNLTRADAEVLKQVALKKLLKLPEPDAGGSPLFELTELITEKVTNFNDPRPNTGMTEDEQAWIG